MQCYNKKCRDYDLRAVCNCLQHGINCKDICIDYKGFKVNKSKNKKQVNKQVIDNLFHHLWTKAVGKPGYIKKEWLEMEHYLYSFLYRDSLTILKKLIKKEKP